MGLKSWEEEKHTGYNCKWQGMEPIQTGNMQGIAQEWPAHTWADKQFDVPDSVDLRELHETKQTTSSNGISLLLFIISAVVTNLSQLHGIHQKVNIGPIYLVITLMLTHLNVTI